MGNDKLRLDEEHIKILETLPEQGMGYQMVDIKLSNGRELKNRTVLNCEYLKLYEGEELCPNDIQEISLHKD